MNYVRTSLDSGVPEEQATGDYIGKIEKTENQTVLLIGPEGTGAYRHLSIKLSSGSVVNDESDTETITISVRDGLEVVAESDLENAAVLDYDGDVTISVDGQQTTKTFTNGTVEFDLTTGIPAGSEIMIVAESLADHPAESDSATIEVVSA